MARKNYKINEEIKVLYQATGATSGLTAVTMEIYDETGAKDGVNFPDVIMTEVGSSGRYIGTFTPDVAGEWAVHIADDNGGKAVKHFSVGGHNVHSIGSDIATVDGKIDTLDGKVDSIDLELDSLTSPPMIG